MTPKEYLKQVFYMSQKIDLLIMEVEQMKELSKSVSSFSYGERVSSGTKNNEAPFVRTLMKINEYEKKINEKIDELVDKKLKIAMEIDKMEDIQERSLLYARYLNDKSWEEIGQQLNYSLRSVHRIHSLALQHFIVPK